MELESQRNPRFYNRKLRHPNVIQYISEINSFDDIKFTKRGSRDMYHANIYNSNGDRLLSIIYGEDAMRGANHGKNSFYNRCDFLPIEQDMGYEIMDNIGDIVWECDGVHNVYVVSKKELLERIYIAKKMEEE